MKTQIMGQHGLLDLYGVDKALLCDEQQISHYLTEAAHLAGATILQSHFHSFGVHDGVTGVLLLSESHMSIHTWPEHQFAAIDIFMCGAHRIQQALTYLETVFVSESCQWQLYERGKLVPK